MPPTHTHLAGGMWNAAAAQTARQVLNKATTVIVVKPVFQIMQTREIFAGAFTAPIAVQFDIVQQAPRSPIRFRLTFKNCAEWQA